MYLIASSWSFFLASNSASSFSLISLSRLVFHSCTTWERSSAVVVDCCMSPKSSYDSDVFRFSCTAASSLSLAALSLLKSDKLPSSSNSASCSVLNSSPKTSASLFRKSVLLSRLATRSLSLFSNGGNFSDIFQNAMFNFITI